MKKLIFRLCLRVLLISAFVLIGCSQPVGSGGSGGKAGGSGTGSVPLNEGTPEAPVDLGTVGSLAISRTAQVENGQAYYQVVVIPSHKYIVNLTGMNGDATLAVFATSEFDPFNELGLSANVGTADEGLKVTFEDAGDSGAVGALLYIGVATLSETAVNYSLRVVDDAVGTEGSVASPMSVGNAIVSQVSHAGMANLGNSVYYSVQTMALLESYDVNVTGISGGDVLLSVYGQSTFTSLVGNSLSSGEDDITVHVSSAPGSVLYIHVQPVGFARVDFVLTISPDLGSVALTPGGQIPVDGQWYQREIDSSAPGASVIQLIPVSSMGTYEIE